MNMLHIEQEADSTDTNAPVPWQVLVVDDDASVHVATELSLRGFRHRGRPITVTRAMSGAEAVRAVRNAADLFDVILMDVVMETPTAGIAAAEDIRRMDRPSGLPGIVLRSGQPGVYSPDRLANLHFVEEFASKSAMTDVILHQLLGKYLDVAQSCRQAVEQPADNEIFRVDIAGPIEIASEMISIVRRSLLESEWARQMSIPYATLLLVSGNLSLNKELAVAFQREIALQRSNKRLATTGLAMLSQSPLAADDHFVGVVSSVFSEIGIPFSIFTDEAEALAWLKATTATKRP